MIIETIMRVKQLAIESQENKLGLEALKKSCSTQLSMKFIMLINVKMPTIVGILSFISTVNSTAGRKIFIFLLFSIVFMNSCNYMLS